MISLSIRRGFRSSCLAWLLAVSAVGAPTFGQDDARKPIEPWADPGLKVTRGLTLWLDAGRLNAARKAHGQPEVSDGTASTTGTTPRATAGT